jgi:hypothetical protein
MVILSRARPHLSFFARGSLLGMANRTFVIAAVLASLHIGFWMALGVGIVFLPVVLTGAAQATVPLRLKLAFVLTYAVAVAGLALSVR